MTHLTHLFQEMDIFCPDAISDCRTETRNQIKAYSINSADWLERHGLEASHLTITDFQKILEKRWRNIDRRGVPTKSRAFSATGMATISVLNEIIAFESEVNAITCDITNRIGWLLQDSRNVFGVTPGDRIGLLVEVSDRFLKSGRHSHLRACLREYVDDQWGALSAKWSHSAQGAKEALYVATYGTEVVTLWNEPVAPSWRSLTEAKQFFNCQLKPSGGSNLLAGLKHMLRIGRKKHLSTVMVVVGSPPDQDADVIFEFLEQSLAVTTTEEDLRFHFVCFDCNSSGMQQLLARLAAVNQHSSLHCYSPVKDGTAFISDDIALLIKELEAARGLLEHVKTKRVQLEAEEAAKNQITGLDNAANEWDELERPLNLSDGDLTRKRTFLPETSKAWLGRHGLNAKNLGLFQILAPNAYPQQSEYVQAIGKQVYAQVYEKAMIQVDWPDGTVRNVHVDVPKLEEYQRKLTAEITLFEQRINWLGRNSRATFGTLAEKCVVLLLDFSEFSRPCLEKMFRYLRHLLQEQIAVYVEWFNLIAICETVEVFHTECVPVNPDNLQEAWVWLLARHAGGTRNFLAGFKYAFERMKDQQQQHQQPVGFYLFATGVADQEDSPLAAYVSSALVVREGYLHCVLFSTEKSKESKESEPIQTGRFADPQEMAQSLRFLANETGGRFHWFSESGVIQSDDVQQLMYEISRAIHFSLTGKQLIDQFRTKYAKTSATSSCEKRTCLRDKTNVISIATTVKPDPNSIPTTSLSEARRIFLRRKQQEAKGISKSLTWQPRRAQSARMKRLTPALTESFFYSEETNKAETVLGRTNKVPGIRKGIRKESIPANEEFVSSSEWLSKYSTKAQRVSLARFLSGIGCRHRTEVIRPGSMQVSARYCADLFPLIQVRGKTRHFQLTPDQCKNFELQVRNLLKRYRKRLFWLLSSPRVYLGVLLEDCIIFVIDISASMQCVVEDLKEKLERIIWEDVCKQKKCFNILAFGSEVVTWHAASPLCADFDACQKAISWLRQLFPRDETTEDAVCLGAALTAALEQTERAVTQLRSQDQTSGYSLSVGIYLVTDGAPGKICSQTLATFFDARNSLTRFVQGSTPAKKTDQPEGFLYLSGLPRVHAITIGDGDITTEPLLRALSHHCEGRFLWTTETQLPIKEYLEARDRQLSLELEVEQAASTELPHLKSDDVMLVLKEIDKCYSMLREVTGFRRLLQQSAKVAPNTSLKPSSTGSTLTHF